MQNLKLKTTSQILKLSLLVNSYLLLTTYYLLLTTKIAYAADCPPNQTQTDLGCIPQTPSGFAGAIYGVGLGMIGAVGLLFIVYGGYLILTSQGNPDQLSKGKSYIIYSIIGIVLALAGFAFYQTIAVDILKIPGFSK